MVYDQSRHHIKRDQPRQHIKKQRHYFARDSLVAQIIKCLPAMRETHVWSLGQKDSLEKEMATHSSILAWKIPWMEEPGRLQSMVSQRVGHNWATSLSFFLYFANKGPSSQGYGFSSGHVWMWELDCEESWALKNWCFWTVVLKKTLESPLNCKEIQPVHPKGDQSWVFIGRTDAEAEIPILWPPHAKSWLMGKDPDAGRDWGQEEKGTTEGEMAGWHHRLDAHEFGWTLGVSDGQGGLALCDSWGCKESDMTERLNWTELRCLLVMINSITLDSWEKFRPL